MRQGAVPPSRRESAPSPGGRDRGQLCSCVILCRGMRAAPFERAAALEQCQSHSTYQRAGLAVVAAARSGAGEGVVVRVRSMSAA